MLTPTQLLEPLARHRTDEVVVATMSVTRPWGRLSDSDLDFASADSAMGHAADLALGIALARPQRTVVCLNGDGSMLMTLGTLATAAGTAATNYRLVIVDNGGFEITGGQPLAGPRALDFAGMARAAGFPKTARYEDAGAWAAELPGFLSEPGPSLAHVRMVPGSQGPISRTSGEEARYLQTSLAEWSRTLRGALAG